MKNQFLILLLITVGGCVLPAATQLGSAIYQPKVLRTPQGEVCPAEEQLERTRNVIRNELLATIHERVLPVSTYECGGTGWTRVVFVNCRQPAVVLPCKTSSTSFRCKFVHDLTTTSRNTWRSLLANSRIPSGTTILQLLELFLCMLLPSLAGTSVPAFRLPVL